jgi:DNA-binding transcriptional ArsR family regulator
LRRRGRTAKRHARIINRTVDFFAARAAIPPMNDAPATDLDLVFAALADPTRRAILGQLLDGECRVGDLAAPLPMSLAAVSKHLQILARSGLVSQVRAGREKTCRLEPDALRAAFLWMQGFGTFAADDFDALERYVELALGELPDPEPEGGTP